MKPVFIPVILILSLIILFLTQPLLYKTGKLIVVAGTGNPGKVFIYEFTANGFVRKEIDTGFKLVHTVRVGDIFNNEKNVIVAGISNSFYGPPFGCQLVFYDPAKNFEEGLIDNVGDLRCKDVAIGDVDNDGKNEVVLGTHGEGIIKLYEWSGSDWLKTDIDKNFIGQIDVKEDSNHLVPRARITYDTIVQSAVHIVKIGDVDNDGKNELVATISSPLEYNGTQLSFVNIYKFDGSKWNMETIHRGEGFQHRSILIEDIDEDGKNEILIGAAPSKLFLIKWMNEEWKSSLVYNEMADKNMKGLDFKDVFKTGKKML